MSLLRSLCVPVARIALPRAAAAHPVSRHVAACGAKAQCPPRRSRRPRPARWPAARVSRTRPQTQRVSSSRPSFSVQLETELPHSLALRTSSSASWAASQLPSHHWARPSSSPGSSSTRRVQCGGESRSPPSRSVLEITNVPAAPRPGSTRTRSSPAPGSRCGMDTLEKRRRRCARTSGRSTWQARKNLRKCGGDLHRRQCPGWSA